MSLHYIDLIQAVVLALRGDAGLVGNESTPALVQGVYAEQAPQTIRLTPESKPYIVVSLVSAVQADTLQQNVSEYVVQVSVFDHRAKSPADCRAALSRVYGDWTPSTGGTHGLQRRAVTMQTDDVATVAMRRAERQSHEQDAWHFLDEYRVFVTQG